MFVLNPEQGFMMDGINKINAKMSSFRRKYYLNLALRGSLLSLSLILFYFLTASIVEYNLWLSSSARLLIFSIFVVLVVFCLYRFLKQPINYWIYRRGLDQEQSARIIGERFPDVNDRLLNLIQLGLVADRSPLLEAGILQKAGQFEHLQFDTAVSFGENRRYLKYFLLPLILIVAILIFNATILTQSTSRLVRFNQEFSPAAPFQFVVENPNLNAFFNEDFTLKVKLAGDAIPPDVFLSSGPQKMKLTAISPGEFELTFEKIQREIPFQLEASGFLSAPQKISIVNRPELSQLKMRFDYPRYLGRKSDVMSNSGNAEVPEGTKVTWDVETLHTNTVTAMFSSEKELRTLAGVNEQSFHLEKVITVPEQYSIHLENGFSNNKENIDYSITVVKDQFPELTVDHLKDSVLYKNVFLGGTASDDNGLTELSLNYEVLRSGKPQSGKVAIPVVRNSLQQHYFYQWHVDSLKLAPGDKLNYFLEVWDNDGVNGRKSTRSATYVFALPDEEELKEDIVRSQAGAQSQMNKSLQKAKDLHQRIDEAQQKLKGKQTLDWQDKKMIDDLMQQKKGLDQMIDKLREQNAQLDEKKDSFSKQDEKVKTMSEQIQKLLDQLMDPETKRLFEEMEKMMKENSDINQLQKMLEKMNRKELNLEQELERAVELFKQMKFDYKLDQLIQNLDQQQKDQEALLNDTEKLAKDETPVKDKSSEKQDNAKNKSTDQVEKNDDKTPDSQSLSKEQAELQEKSAQTQKDLEELKKMGDELDQNVNPSQEKQQEINDAQENSKESLSKGQPKKSAESQKKAVQKMKEMKEQLQGLQQEMGMEMDMQNLESLRQILHGMIKLSFDQEQLMKEFSQIQQTDPKYIQLSQNQLKIKDDSKVLEDSLIDLSKRDAFLSSIVTKEISDLNSHLDKSAESVRERRKPNAASEMQLSMTSINNLALMLNDHFDEMMNMMSSPGAPGKKKMKMKMPGPSLSELQKKLNEKIQGLKNGPKSGRAYSEELAKAAAEQERIRRALQEMQEKFKQEGGSMPGDLPGKMEQTEMDLVNKKITEQTIRRQKEIETRLLEAENSMREQDLDQERKGEAAKEYDKELPKGFEEYLRLKEKEVELLKSVPPKFSPYYKKEVNEYFKRIRTQN